jgi:hypothetical protein
MRAYFAGMFSVTRTSIWRGVYSALFGRTDPEVEEVARKLSHQERDYRTRLVQRSIERGELPKGANAELIGDMCSAPILRRVLTFGEAVDDEYIEAVIEVTLTGAAILAMRRSSSG